MAAQTNSESMLDHKSLGLLVERLSDLLNASEQRTSRQLDAIYSVVSGQREQIQELAASMSGATQTTAMQSGLDPRRTESSQLKRTDGTIARELTRSASMSICGRMSETQRKAQLRAKHGSKGDLGDPKPGDEVAVAEDTARGTRTWQVVLKNGGVPSVVEAKNGKEDQTLNTCTCHPLVDWAIRHPNFDLFWLGIIILNAIFLGVQLQVYITSGKYHISNVIGETLFTFLFVIELTMRLVRDGAWKYFCGPAFGWAWLDVFIISLSIFDIVVTHARIDLNEFVSSFAILRTARALRIAKVIRGIRFLRNLRLLLAGMINSVLAIIWTVVAIVSLMYLGSILVVSVVADEILAGEPYYVETWGGLFTSMGTLFQVMSGDAWWSLVVANLRDDFPGLPIFFILYYCATALGLLNIVTGIFVEQTLNTSKTDAEILKDQSDEANVATTAFLTDVFKMMDSDDDGKVFYDEFERFVSEPMVQFALDQAHLKVPDVLNLFEILDKNGDDRVDVTEFVKGCLTARGSPTRADIIESSVRSRNLLMEVLRLLNDITQRLDNGSMKTQTTVHDADECVFDI